MWDTYFNNSLSICVFKHYLSNVDDKNTKALIQDGLKLSEKYVKEIKEIFSEENLPVPNAFSEADVNLEAPRLFNDSFYLYYLSNMLSFGIDGYSIILRYAARVDVLDFYLNCIAEAGELYRKVINLRLNQGTFVKAPTVEVNKETSFLHKDSFLAGIMTKPRPLLAREVGNIFGSILIDVLCRTAAIGFGQTTTLPEVKAFMFKGRDIASEHFSKYSSFLTDEHIPVPSFSDSFVTDSTTPPFSDKLMMTQILIFYGFKMGVNGIAATSSVRSDITATLSRFTAEVGKQAVEGYNIMVNNNWMEQPPQVIKHENLKAIQD